MINLKEKTKKCTKCGEIKYIPQSSFDFENEDELKKCWALSNLQPLWAFDNRSKGAKILCR